MKDIYYIPILDPEGRNQKLILVIFEFKWEQESLLLKFTDLYRVLTSNLLLVLYGLAYPDSE